MSDGGPLDLDGGPTDAGPLDAGADVDAGPLPPPVVDFVLVADNAFGMTDELAALEAAFYGSWVAPLDAAGADWRIVLVTDHGGASFELCIGLPLGSNGCTGTSHTTGPRFFHYDLNVPSGAAACRLLDAWDGAAPDEAAALPSGVQSVLRPEARKVVIVATDNGLTCTSTVGGFDDVDTGAGGDAAGAAVDQALLQKGPTQLGSADDRRYVVHSVVGIDAGGAALPPSAPVALATCPTAMAPGTGYQALSRLTGGLRFSSCDLENDAAPILEAIVAAELARP